VTIACNGAGGRASLEFNASRASPRCVQLFGKQMSSLDRTLENLIRRHTTTLKCAAIVHASGEVTNRVGDFTAFEQQGLASAVLGPYGDPAASFRLAADYEDDRKMLPQTVCQGDLFALLDKPKTDFVLVAFGVKGQNSHEHLRHRKEISITIAELFGTNKP
jgi:hypothetical protein